MSLASLCAKVVGSSCRLVSALLSPLKVTNLNRSFVTFGIKAGTFCRTMWVVFPPIFLYQYIRQTDEEMRATELLFQKSENVAPERFYNFEKPGLAGHWRIQQDLALIFKAANPGLFDTEDKNEESNDDEGEVVTAASDDSEEVVPASDDEEGEIAAEDKVKVGEIASKESEEVQSTTEDNDDASDVAKGNKEEDASEN